MSGIAFDILRGLNDVGATVKGYQALPFVPASIISPKSGMATGSFDKGDGPTRETQSVTGAPLRKYKGGVYYFMPVTFYWPNSKNPKLTVEFDDAVVSVSAKKTIVETALVGRKGTVKELISIDDYEINLVAVVAADDYPEQEVQKIIRLWEVNESVKMSCAITDYFLKDDDRVVIKSLDFPAMEGNEEMQAVTMKLVSDSPFELEK